MDFKERFELLRKAQHLSFVQVASEFEKSESAVRAWSTGRTKPDVDTLIKLANYFDCTTDYLLGLTNSRNEKRSEALKESYVELVGLIENIDGGWNFMNDLLELINTSKELDDKDENIKGLKDGRLAGYIDIVNLANAAAREAKQYVEKLESSTGKEPFDVSQYLMKSATINFAREVVIDRLNRIFSLYVSSYSEPAKKFADEAQSKVIKGVEYNAGIRLFEDPIFKNRVMELLRGDAENKNTPQDEA